MEEREVDGTIQTRRIRLQFRGRVFAGLVHDGLQSANFESGRRQHGDVLTNVGATNGKKTSWLSRCLSQRSLGERVNLSTRVVENAPEKGQAPDAGAVNVHGLVGVLDDADDGGLKAGGDEAACRLEERVPNVELVVFALREKGQGPRLLHRPQGSRTPSAKQLGEISKAHLRPCLAWRPNDPGVYTS